MIFNVLIAASLIQYVFGQCKPTFDTSDGNVCKYCYCDPEQGRSICFTEADVSTNTDAQAYLKIDCPGLNSCNNGYVWGTTAQCVCPTCSSTVTTTTTPTTTSSGGGEGTTTTSGTVTTTTYGVCTKAYDFKRVEEECQWCDCTNNANANPTYTCRNYAAFTSTDETHIKAACSITCSKSDWILATSADESCCPKCPSTGTTTTTTPTSTSSTPTTCEHEYYFADKENQCEWCRCSTSNNVATTTCRTQETVASDDYSTIKNYCNLACDYSTWVWGSPTINNYFCCPKCPTTTTSPSDSTTTKVETTSSVSSTECNVITLQFIENQCKLCKCYNANSNVNYCSNLYSNDAHTTISDTNYVYLQKACPDIAACEYSHLVWTDDCACPKCDSTTTTTKEGETTKEGDTTTTRTWCTSDDTIYSDSIKCDDKANEIAQEPAGLDSFSFQGWINSDNVWDSRSQVWLTCKSSLRKFLSDKSLTTNLDGKIWVEAWAIKCQKNGVTDCDVDSTRTDDDSENTKIDTVTPVNQTEFKSGVNNVETGKTRRLQETTNAWNGCSWYISIAIYPGTQDEVNTIVAIIQQYFTDIPYDLPDDLESDALAYDSTGFQAVAVSKVQYTQRDSNGNIVATGVLSDAITNMVNMMLLLCIIVLSLLLQ